MSRKLFFIGSFVLMMSVLGWPGTDSPKIRKYVLKEALSIGGDMAEEAQLAIPRTLDVDKKGNIYITDIKSNQVKIYNGQGIHLLDIGKPGRGPGDLLNPVDAIVGPDQAIHVLDINNRKIARYKPDGKFLSEFKFRGVLVSIFPLKGGGYIAFKMEYNTAGEVYPVYVLFSREGKIIKKTTSLCREPIKIMRYEKHSFFLKTPYDAEHYPCSDSQGIVYHGYSDRYEIDRYDTRLEKVGVIKQEQAQIIKTTAKERNDYFDYLKKTQKKTGRPEIAIFKKSRKFPSHRPLFKGLFVDHKDRLMVWVPGGDNAIHMDVFNSDGTYIEKMILDYSKTGIDLKKTLHAPLFKKDCLYCRVNDEEGTYFIKKYRILPKK